MIIQVIRTLFVEFFCVQRILRYCVQCCVQECLDNLRWQRRAEVMPFLWSLPRADIRKQSQHSFSPGRDIESRLQETSTDWWELAHKTKQGYFFVLIYSFILHFQVLETQREEADRGYTECPAPPRLSCISLNSPFPGYHSGPFTEVRNSGYLKEDSENKSGSLDFLPPPTVHQYLCNRQVIILHRITLGQNGYQKEMNISILAMWSFTCV